MSRFDECLAETLSHEGGWSDNSSDPGGATMKGVTLSAFRAFKGRRVSKAELRGISDADLRAFYRSGYWDKVRGDDLPPGLDLIAFDAAVNSGPAQGAKWLQRALGVKDDGVIGPETIAAANRANARIVIERACNLRMALLHDLSTWPVFGKSWSRRVAAIRAKANDMAQERAIQPPRPRPAPLTPEQAPRPLAASPGPVVAVLNRIFSFLNKGGTA